jgi:hypothetical protein
LHGLAFAHPHPLRANPNILARGAPSRPPFQTQIYAQIARKHRDQIAHVYIRNAPTKKLGALPAEQTRQLLKKKFHGLPDDMWTVFDRASTIADDAKSWPWPAK